MPAYGAGDQVAGQGQATNLPNFVGELFKLSPLETPFLSMIGGKTGGIPTPSPVFTWQDTLHRTPAIQANDEGADATFVSQKRAERRNVVAIHQYGVELSYTKQGATGILGAQNVGMDTPPLAANQAVSILGNQPVQTEMSWQLQIKIEQCALDVEVMFLNGTYAYPNDETARQTQGIVGAVSADTTTTYAAASDQALTRDAVNDISKKLFDNGAKWYDVVLMINSLSKLDLGNDYALNSSGWNVQPRSYNRFGVNVTDIETEFHQYPVVLNRHISQDQALFVDLGICNPRFLPIPGKGHFFLEPLSKLGSYDRAQLYGEIGLEYGPSGWHGLADNLHDV